MSQSSKQMAGNQRRTLRTMRERVLAMSAEWDGVDGFIETRLNELADAIEAVAVDLVIDDGGEG